MTTTRAAIRRRAVSLARINGHSRGFASRDAGVTALTATGGTTTTLIDTAGLPPAGAASTTAKGNWVYRPAQAAANQKRLVASYSGANRTITIETGTDWTVAPAASDPYLILKDDPDVWDSAMYEALRTLLTTVKYDEITFTSANDDLSRYTLSAAPFTLARIVRDTQVMDIEVRDSGDASGEERWVPWANGSRTWQTYMDEQDVILDFGSARIAPSTSDRIRVKWTDQFTIPAAESTSIAVDEYWAALATLVVMADWLADPNNAEDDWNMIGARARRQYVGQRRGILGADAFRQVSRTAQTAAVGGVRGRGGRG